MGWRDPRRAPEQEVAAMLEMRRRGMTYREIGDKFGLTWSTVAHRLGCKPTRRPPYRRPCEPGYQTL
jgi:hypothetical protein